jgi:hypothetical protein
MDKPNPDRPRTEHLLVCFLRVSEKTADPSKVLASNHPYKPTLRFPWSIDTVSLFFL